MTQATIRVRFLTGIGGDTFNYKRLDEADLDAATATRWIANGVCEAVKAPPASAARTATAPTGERATVRGKRKAGK